jgi:hypothetical protein
MLQNLLLSFTDVAGLAKRHRQIALLPGSRKFSDLIQFYFFLKEIYNTKSVKDTVKYTTHMEWSDTNNTD